MYFADDALLPENQDELIINVAPYGPEWLPGDFPEDIAVTLDDQVQKAVDCYNAGATVLHLHVREPDGKGSKRLSKFNELIAGIRARVPDLIILSMTEAGYAHLYAYSPDSLPLTRLTDDPWDDITPALSPDGKWIAYASRRNDY